MTQGELAAYIDTNLRNNGIYVVLSGGACVAVYSSYKYVSKDLDFIAVFTLDHKKVESLMKEIGFEKQGRNYFHPETNWYTEFISGPPGVGQNPIGEIHKIPQPTGNLRILSPADSVKDRLAAFYHWGDRQCLEQALLVAESNQVDLESIKTWSVLEGKKEGFEVFKRRLEEKYL
jgi:hypothetical protein